MSKHYDEDYFKWQKNIGEFGGWANQHKFVNHIQNDMTVLDFGCGGGFLLNNIECANKIGLEVNLAAAEHLKQFNISHFQTVQDALKILGEESIDVIISNNALEHTFNPLEELKGLYKLLKTRTSPSVESQEIKNIKKQNALQSRIVLVQNKILEKEREFNQNLRQKNKNTFNNVEDFSKIKYKFTEEEQDILNIKPQFVENIFENVKGSGLIKFVVPCDNVMLMYDPDDINKHLFSWSPMNLGNIFTEAGFCVLYSRPLIHKWPPNYLEIAKEGWKVFNEACKKYGKIEDSWFQVEILAEKL